MLNYIPEGNYDSLIFIVNNEIVMEQITYQLVDFATICSSWSFPFLRHATAGQRTQQFCHSKVSPRPQGCNTRPATNSIVQDNTMPIIVILIYDIDDIIPLFWLSLLLPLLLSYYDYHCHRITLSNNPFFLTKTPPNKNKIWLVWDFRFLVGHKWILIVVVENQWEQQDGETMGSTPY